MGKKGEILNINYLFGRGSRFLILKDDAMDTDQMFYGTPFSFAVSAFLGKMRGHSSHHLRKRGRVRVSKWGQA